MLSIAELTPVIEEKLRSHLDKFGFRAVDVRADRDHHGDPVVVADAHYREGAPTLDSRAKSQAINDIMRYMVDKGDDRFLWLRSHFDGDVFAEDEQPEKRS
jgi:hypothetical protein